MASKFRSLIASRIICAAGRLSVGSNVVPSSVIPLVKVNTKPGPHFEFKVSLSDLWKSGLLGDIKRSSFPSAASALVENIQTDSTISAVYLQETTSAVNLNFKVHNLQVLESLLGVTLQQPNSFWKFSDLICSLPEERVIVEYSSPNIAKPFHVGHLRSTIIGNCLANLFEAVGFKVTRINYLGDWGTQFGLLKYGYDAKGMKADDLKHDPIRKLYDVYVWANQKAEELPEVASRGRAIFAQMEKGDEKELGDWRLFRHVSIEDMKKLYKRLNVRFDEYFGESMYPGEKCQPFLDLMKSKGLSEITDDGRTVYRSGGNNVTVAKSDGSCLYITRDIAGAVDRFEKFKFTKMYYVVGNSQANHFISLFKILLDLGFEWAEGLCHVKFGQIEGMSSRRGTAIFLQDILDDAYELMQKKQLKSKKTKASHMFSREEVDDIVGTSYIVVADLKQLRGRSYNFSWEAILKDTSHSGYFLQHSHCRLMNLEENCGVNFTSSPDFSLLTEPCVLELVRVMARFDEVLLESYRLLEPYVLVNYLFTLCGTTTLALKQLPVKHAERKVAEARLPVFIAARHTLAAGMRILGLQPLDAM